jgi:hypothetical protein
MSLARKKPLVNVAAALPRISPLPEDPPPLENVPVHVQLARANSRHAKLTEELRTLKANFAAENIKAQQTRTPIPTSRITFVETKRRELHLALEATQSEIGKLNKLVREGKVHKQGNGSRQPPQAAPPKTGPLRDHPKWDFFVRLACENQLPPEMLKRVEAEAKGLLSQALRTGIDQ